MTRTEFLRRQTVTAANKCRRTPMPPASVANERCGLTERRAMALVHIFKTMPIYIGPRELIVGTRTLFSPNEGNEDGHDRFEYSLPTPVAYLNEAEIAAFGCDQSYLNRTHFTPDFGIILDRGVDGIIADAETRLRDASLHSLNRDFLSGVILAYRGLKTLITRYAEEAERMAAEAEGEAREELFEIARVCRRISGARPESLREAIQLLWFTHLGTIIESFEFINYGRLDVLLTPYLKDTPRDEAQQLIDCLLLKMYDQTDLVTSYLGKYAAQLVVTLGGVLPDGKSAVSEITMMFLDAADRIRLPEPELNLRVSSKNPPAFLDRASELTVSGCNFVSYYNDDLFVENLHRAGIPLDLARSYGFDLCQDINIPGWGDFWLAGSPNLTGILMKLLGEVRNFPDWGALSEAFRQRVSETVERYVKKLRAGQEQLALYASGREDDYFDGIRSHGKPVDRGGASPMSPLPFLSALYHGAIDRALDVAFEPYPVKAKGMFFGTATEAINSLAAIKKTVYDEKRFTLDEIRAACESNFEDARGRLIRAVLWNCPKWGNDDDYVDAIAKDLLEFCLRECQKHKTYHGGAILGGIHQPHPIPTGAKLPATPEGRAAGAPVAVTLTPESGTAKYGPTATLASAAKIDPSLVHWNYCVMVNYFASVFAGNGGKEVFQSLLKGYFASGGLQHQPNVLDVESLKQAQLEPEKYRDLIVRLWGVSAHFVDLPRELQDEMIARFA